jgi:hypothetical protein
MKRAKNPDETTLLIKLPPELKASFQGLCKFRGVSVSEELRRFMADEVTGTAHGMTTRDKPEKLSHARVSLANINQVVSRQNSYKDAVQGDLELLNSAKSAINATNRRKKQKSSKK